jgi:hypothetical protein
MYNFRCSATWRRHLRRGLPLLEHGLEQRVDVHHARGAVAETVVVVALAWPRPGMFLQAPRIMTIMRRVRARVDLTIRFPKKLF